MKLTFELYACQQFKCDMAELQSFIKDNPTRAIVLAEKYHKAEVKKELNSHKSLCLSILEQSDKPISQRIREVKEQLLKQ